MTQYARTATKTCPLFDPACATRVAAIIQDFYPQPAPYGCSCNLLGAQTGLASHIARERARGLDVADLDAALVALTHQPECLSLQPAPARLDAVALIEKECGRYTRGQHKGQLRGWATITVCEVGGWKRQGPGERNGGVLRPGQVLSVEIGDSFSGKVYLRVGR